MLCFKDESSFYVCENVKIPLTGLVAVILHEILVS